METLCPCGSMDCWCEITCYCAPSRCGCSRCIELRDGGRGLKSEDAHIQPGHKATPTRKPETDYERSSAKRIKKEQSQPHEDDHKNSISLSSTLPSVKYSPESLSRNMPPTPPGDAAKDICSSEDYADVKGTNGKVTDSDSPHIDENSFQKRKCIGPDDSHFMSMEAKSQLGPEDHFEDKGRDNAGETLRVKRPLFPEISVSKHQLRDENSKQLSLESQNLPELSAKDSSESSDESGRTLEPAESSESSRDSSSDISQPSRVVSRRCMPIVSLGENVAPDDTRFSRGVHSPKRAGSHESYLDQVSQSPPLRLSAGYVDEVGRRNRVVLESVVPPEEFLNIPQEGPGDQDRDSSGSD